MTRPLEADEGTPGAWLVYDPELVEGLKGVTPGDYVLVLTWLGRARRDVLRVHPRRDAARPLEGVLSKYWMKRRGSMGNSTSP